MPRLEISGSRHADEPNQLLFFNRYMVEVLAGEIVIELNYEIKRVNETSSSQNSLEYWVVPTGQNLEVE